MIQDSMAQKLQSFAGVKILNIVPLVLKINTFTSSTKEVRELLKNNFQPKVEFKLLIGITKIKYWLSSNKANPLFTYGHHLQQTF